MKFWAKVNLKGKEEAENLLKAFWEDFHPDSSIHIKGGVANLEVVFEEKSLPKLISRAIFTCEDYEFHYEKKSQEEISEPEKKCNSDSKKKSREPEKSTKSNELSELGAQVLRRKKNVNLESEELKQIAKKSNSYEHFIISVAKWIEIKHREELFIKLATYSTNLEVISWKALEESGISFNISDRNLMSKQVSVKFANSKNPLRILELLEAIKLYRDYDFGVTNSNLVDNGKTKVKMNCMPEIPLLEEALMRVNKTQPIEERVREVLSAMGLSKKSSEEQKELLEFTKIAVTHRLINDDIFVSANIPMEGVVMARMKLSEFINSFMKVNVQKYDETIHKVRAYDFLKDLQLIIVNENEIQNS